MDGIGKQPTQGVNRLAGSFVKLTAFHFSPIAEGVDKLVKPVFSPRIVLEAGETRGKLTHPPQVARLKRKILAR